MPFPGFPSSNLVQDHSKDITPGYWAAVLCWNCTPRCVLPFFAARGFCGGLQKVANRLRRGVLLATPEK
eukprot:5695574-Amphidinium_carterae.1